MPLAARARQGFVALRAPVLRTPLPPTRRSGRGTASSRRRPEQERGMERLKNASKMVAGGLLAAIAVYVLLALPGLISDESSTVAILSPEARR